MGDLKNIFREARKPKLRPPHPLRGEAGQNFSTRSVSSTANEAPDCIFCKREFIEAHHSGKVASQAPGFQLAGITPLALESGFQVRCARESLPSLHPLRSRLFRRRELLARAACHRGRGARTMSVKNTLRPAKQATGANNPVVPKGLPCVQKMAPNQGLNAYPWFEPITEIIAAIKAAERETK